MELLEQGEGWIGQGLVESKAVKWSPALYLNEAGRGSTAHCAGASGLEAVGPGSLATGIPCGCWLFVLAGPLGHC